MRIYVLAGILASIASLSCARQNQTRPHVFYLHGMIVEVQGINAVSEAFGPYRYTDIVDSLKASGYEVHSEVRPPDTPFEAYVQKISDAIDGLIRQGVQPESIGVIGASYGAQMAMAVSNRNTHPVRYILLGANSDRLENAQSWKLHGHILGIYERTDQIAGKDYTYWLNRSTEAESFEQLEINTGLGHGFLYRPLQAWLQPTRAWLARSGTSR